MLPHIRHTHTPAIIRTHFSPYKSETRLWRRRRQRTSRCFRWVSRRDEASLCAVGMTARRSGAHQPSLRGWCLAGLFQPGNDSYVIKYINIYVYIYHWAKSQYWQTQTPHSPNKMCSSTYSSFAKCKPTNRRQPCCFCIQIFFRMQCRGRIDMPAVGWVLGRSNGNCGMENGLRLSFCLQQHKKLPPTTPW